MESLRIMTCGSVDDGKSTLIGRLLYDSQALFDDQIQALKKDSQFKEELEYAYLLDGLSAEREQGITIDVAYRYFKTARRSFIVADTPGHAQYTRNMAVGASFADLAILLIDISKGLQEQTKRHLRICHMMGIQHYVFAVNKMDLVAYDQIVFQKLEQDLQVILNSMGIQDGFAVIPLSAKKGENLLESSSKMSWYKGLALLPYLEQVQIHSRVHQSFVFPVQRVSRPHAEFRGFQGQVISGQLETGDVIRVLPSKLEARVSELHRLTEKVERVKAGDPITLVLDREIDISRGNVLVTGEGIDVGKDLEVELLWLNENPLQRSVPYLMKVGTKQVSATITAIKAEIDIDSGQEFSPQNVEQNSLSICHLSTFEPIAFSEFDQNQEMGRFILMDKLSQQTVAAGVIKKPLAKARNLFQQKERVSRQERGAQKRQKPLTIWFTGLSGAGKSTLASLLEQELMAHGKHTMLLDGDNVRLGLNKNLGFRPEDRFENLRRIAEVAKLMNDAGLITIVSTISPTATDRQNARQIIGAENFIEIYLSTSLAECERRDTKGLYRKARSGEIQNFTGIDAPYEVPTQAQIQMTTEGRSIEDSLQQLLEEVAPYIE